MAFCFDLNNDSPSGFGVTWRLGGGQGQCQGGGEGEDQGFVYSGPWVEQSRGGAGRGGGAGYIGPSRDRLVLPSFRPWSVSDSFVF